jgi:hypothetical protein
MQYEQEPRLRLAPLVISAVSRVIDVDDAPSRMDEDEFETVASLKARGGNIPGNAYRDILLVVRKSSESG